MEAIQKNTTDKNSAARGPEDLILAEARQSLAEVRQSRADLEIRERAARARMKDLLRELRA